MLGKVKNVVLMLVHKIDNVCLDLADFANLITVIEVVGAEPLVLVELQRVYHAFLPRKTELLTRAVIPRSDTLLDHVALLSIQIQFLLG